MSQERAEAVLLRGIDFSETSRILTFLTAGRGRVSCLAKGARRAKSPFAGALDTLNRLEIVYYWKDNRSVQQLGEAAVLDRFNGIKGNLAKSAYAALAAEVALHTARENEPSQALYDCFVRGLASLDHWSGNVRAHACWQVLQLLIVAGFAPAIEFCAGCGGTPASTPGFSFEGGVTCGSCPSERRLSAESYAGLRALTRSFAACPPLADAGGLYGLVWRYATRQLETDLKSARVIEELERKNGFTEKTDKDFH